MLDAHLLSDPRSLMRRRGCSRLSALRQRLHSIVVAPGMHLKTTAHFLLGRPGHRVLGLDGVVQRCT